MKKQGVLLINIGTPTAPTALSVASYLNMFLSDNKVVDLPYFFRQILVKGFIIPFRTKQVLKAYRSIWTPAGSPLRVHMQALQAAMQATLDAQQQTAVVALGMRYGEPSIQQGITALRRAGCTFLHIIPLYPQYAVATTGSALAVVLDIVKESEPIIPFQVYPPFYEAPDFIQAFAEQIRAHQQQYPATIEGAFTLFSYHGLPERQIRNMGCTYMSQRRQQVNCLKCNQATSKDMLTCYRAQCFMTTTALIQTLGLDSKQTATVFQSRVGKIPWIRPYTDQFLVELAQRKVKRIVVVCPSFTVDCLETLEEIEIRAKTAWKALGGEHLSLVPSLNTHPTWVKTLVNWISKRGIG